MTIDQFGHDLQRKQMLRQTSMQTLNCRITTLLTMVPSEKKGFFNNKKNKKIGAFVIDKQIIEKKPLKKENTGKLYNLPSF